MTPVSIQPTCASQVPRPWQPQSVEVGPWTVTALCDGYFRLDGGAMWGVVPQVLWRRMTPPAADNTLLVGVRPFLCERDGMRVLLEPGIGQRWETKARERYALQPTTTLVDSLAACGVSCADVTHVVASHCHWDHIGAQVVEREGELVPLFPAARHFAPAVEVERAKHPGHARRASYRPDDVTPIERAGLLETYDGTSELLPGLRAHVLGGHSDGVTVVTLNECTLGPTAIFWSDVVPTSWHVQPPYIMAFDVDVARSFDVRSEWIRRACEEDWIGLYFHDVDVPFGKLSWDGVRYVHVPVATRAR